MDFLKYKLPGILFNLIQLTFILLKLANIAPISGWSWMFVLYPLWLSTALEFVWPSKDTMRKVKELQKTVVKDVQDSTDKDSKDELNPEHNETDEKEDDIS